MGNYGVERDNVIKAINETLATAQKEMEKLKKQQRVEKRRKMVEQPIEEETLSQMRGPREIGKKRSVLVRVRDI